MFHRLHIQFTLFFTLGTSLILAAMTGICLYISQSSLTDGSYQTFVNSVSSALSYLEAQNTIPHQWIREQEQNNHFSIRILDNQHPLFFSQLEEEPALTPVYQAALDKAKQDYALDLDTYTEKSMLPQHVEFRMDDSGQSDYYASVAFLPKSNGSLSVITLYPLDLLHQQLSRQRLFFLFADLVGILSLALFSWIYTGKLLIPIQKNRRQQTQFIASASHELRTPLAVIRSCLSALQKGSPGDALHFQQIIDQETQRMTRLIQDMLYLANADNQSWTIVPSWVELDTLLFNLYEKYEPLAQEKKCRLTVSLPDQPCSPCKCDENRIEQVLSIFMDNALSYTPSGGEIHLSLSQTGGLFQLSVSDNGPGIPDAEKEAIFQRFYRSDQSRHKKGHYGLGLSIAQEIAHLHHASLRLEDTPGGGATFLLTLARAKNIP